MITGTVDTGHVFAVVGFQGPWPSKHEVRVLGRHTNDFDITMVATQHRTMRFTVRGGARTRVVESHALELQGAGLAVIDVGWDEHSMTIHINGQLASGLSSAHPPLHVALGGLGGDGMLSLNDPAAFQACAKWRAKRQRMTAAVRLTPKPSFRRKSLGEQLNELERATLALADLILLVQRGRLHLVGHVATILRALLHWRGRGYNPLLLRLAAVCDLPLPVYIVPHRNPADLAAIPAQEFTTGDCSLFRVRTAQRLGDLQDWLSTKTLRLSEGLTRELTVMEAIAMAANTLGSAHYDEDVPVVLETVLSLSGQTADALTTLIGSAASIVHPLSKYVLIEVRKRTAVV